MVHDKVNERLKNYIEYDWRVVIPSEDSLTELEYLGHPLLCNNLSFQLGVQVHIVGNFTLRNIVVFQAECNEVVSYGSIRVSQIIPGQMNSLLGQLGQHTVQIMANTMTVTMTLMIMMRMKIKMGGPNDSFDCLLK